MSTRRRRHSKRTSTGLLIGSGGGAEANAPAAADIISSAAAVAASDGQRTAATSPAASSSSAVSSSPSPSPSPAVTPAVDLAILFGDTPASRDYLKCKVRRECHLNGRAYQLLANSRDLAHLPFGLNKELKFDYENESVWVGEGHLQLLHIVDQVVQQRSQGTRMRIAFVPASVLQARLECVIASEDGEDEGDDTTAGGGAGSGRASRLPTFTPMSELARYDSTWEGVSFTTVRNWSQLVGSSIRRLYLPSLMWYSELASCERLHSALLRVVSEHSSTLRPSRSIEQELVFDHKHRVYSQLRKAGHMVTTRWHDTRVLPVDQLAASMLVDLSDGEYMLKGTFACCRGCVDKIVVRDGACAELEDYLTTYIEEKKQTHVGVQDFVAGFGDAEYRLWMVRADSSGAWKVNVILRTGWSVTSNIEYLRESHDSPAALACLAVLQEMFRHPALHALNTLRVLAMRCDFGWTPERGAFFNEFAAAPDAAMFSRDVESTLLQNIALAATRDILDLTQRAATGDHEGRVLKPSARYEQPTLLTDDDDEDAEEEEQQKPQASNKARRLTKSGKKKTK